MAKKRADAARSRSKKPRHARRRAVVWLALSLLAAAAAASAVWAVAGGGRWAEALSCFRVREVRVVGLKYVRRSDFLDYVGDPSGTPVWDVDVGRMQRRVKGHPWIEEASVKRELPGAVVIRVRERTPAAVVVTGTGRSLVDAGGATLGRVRGRDWDFLPVITCAGRTPAGAEAIRDAVELTGLVRGDPAEALAGGRVSIGRDGSPRLLLDKTVVRFGRGAYGDKVRRLSELMREIRRRDAHPALIDLRFPGKVVVSDRRRGRSG